MKRTHDSRALVLAAALLGSTAALGGCTAGEGALTGLFLGAVIGGSAEAAVAGAVVGAAVGAAAGHYPYDDDDYWSDAAAAEYYADCDCDRCRPLH